MTFINFLITVYFYILSFFDRPIKNINGEKLKGKTIIDKPKNISIEVRIRNTLEKYGPLYYTYDGFQRIIMIGNYRLAKEYYNSHRHHTIRKYKHLGYVFEKLLIDSIGANHSHQWLLMKKPLTHFFTHKSLENHFDMIIKKSNDWIRDNFVENNKIKQLNEIGLDKLTITILSYVIYGELKNCEIEELQELSHLHNKMMVIMSQDRALQIPIIHKKFSTKNSKLVDLFWTKWTSFNDQRKQYICENTLFEQMIKSDSYKDKTKMYQTLYEIMLFNLDIMIDAFANLIWNIASHTEVRQKIYDECKNTEITSYKQIDELQYLTRVINESARLNPGIVITFAETITKQLSLDEYCLPENTLISLDTQMINRDPNVWDNPNDFNPDRFLNHETTKSLFKFHRFGLDQRKCLGNIFADYILKVGIVSIIKKFNFEPYKSTCIDKIEKPLISARESIPNLCSYDMINKIIFTDR